jgi:hypothetical protein
VWGNNQAEEISGGWDGIANGRKLAKKVETIAENGLRGE